MSITEWPYFKLYCMQRVGKFILFVFFLVVCSQTLSQISNISGTVTDSMKNPIKYAAINLKKVSTPSQVISVLTDSLGKFTVGVKETGRYILTVEGLAYRPYVTDTIVIKNMGENITIGNLIVRSQPAELEQVTVESVRPVITQMADKMVVSVAGTAMAAGNTAFGVLSKSPGVFVDPEGNIQLNGRSGVSVMIDGRLTYMSARELRNYLEAMPAENIKSIELITNPSSRFDAQGSSGIINIVLKKNTVDGIQGSVSTSYTYNFKQHIYSTGSSVNFKKGRWNSFINLDLSRRAGGREATFTRIFRSGASSIYFDQIATGNYKVTNLPTIRTGSDYSINQQSSFGFLLNYNRTRGESDFITDTELGQNPTAKTQSIQAVNREKSKSSNFSANIHYVQKLDTMGSVFSVDVDYAVIKNDGQGNFNNVFVNLQSNQQTTDRLLTQMPNGYDVLTARADLVFQLNKAKRLEIGARTGSVVADNDFRFYFNNTGLIVDPSRTNHFLFRERISAGYITWAMPGFKDMTLQFGLRGEHTSSFGRSITTGQQNRRNYFNLFPTFFIQQKVSSQYDLNISYSRRIGRPNYSNLNPFRFYRDPYTWSEGNPFLRPQFSHVVVIGNTFKKRYILQFSYVYTKDVISEIPILDVSNNITIYTNGNVDRSHSAGVTAIIPVKIIKGWDTRNVAQLFYNDFRAFTNNGRVDNKQWLAVLQSIHTVLLPKDLRGEVTMLVRGPNASGLYRMKGFYTVDVALRKTLAKGKFELGLRATDLFKSYRYIWSTRIADNVNDFDQYFRLRTINLSFRYNFTKGKRVNVAERKTVEEMGRL